MQIINYEKLYSLPAYELDNLNNNDVENFIFQGSTNWDFYFDTFVKNDDISELKNVSLLEFTDKKDFEKYLAKKQNIIDYSMEHFTQLGKYFVLVKGKK